MLRNFISDKEIIINVLSFPHGKDAHPDWQTVISKTPADSHLLVILGKCDSNSKLNHFISINLISNVAYDSGIPCVSFKFNMRSLPQLVLKTPIAIATVKFIGSRHLQHMIFPANFNTSTNHML